MGFGEEVFLRSSAINEGMDERGQFESVKANISDLSNGLFALLEKIVDIPNEGMPIVVQPYIEYAFKGHMSNERRLSKENRDWKVETYFENDEYEQDTIGVRTWRTKFNVPEIISQSLTCSKEGVVGELQKVAYYWYILSRDNKCRYHLEFLFDGKKIYIVQADKAFTKKSAVNPRDYEIRITAPKEERVFEVLKKYDPSTKSEYSKLENIRVYATLNVRTVPYYVLDDFDIINELKQGNVCAQLERDIKALLEIQSIVIRMDVLSEKREEKQMLPRSYEMRDYVTVVKWLLKHASESCDKGSEIFIIHNFVPARSAAFVHVVPNNRIVRIQSLWGLPEGLYYNSHDTIVVDLGTSDVERINPRKVGVTIKRKYKDQFVVPDSEGVWRTQNIAEPYDWKCSIEKSESILELAVVSQKVANHLKKEISAMWFVGIDKSYYGVENLLWFHEAVDIFSYTIDNYKRKYFVAEEFVVESSDQVKDLIANGVKNIKCLRIKPTCEKDLRNKEFILEVGEFAQKHDIMILLDGTQLTHLYYQLKMTNAKVVCSEKDELLYSDTLEFNKLVRDRIPEKIMSNGEQIKCAYITEELLDRMLLEKLLEEAYEVSDAHNTQDIMSELADVMEICIALLLRSEKCPISARDLLHNRKASFIDDYLNISSFLIPIRDTQCHYTFRHENLYGVVKIERQKTVYRVEVDLKNGEFDTPKIVDDEKDEISICQLKNRLVKRCSMLLNVTQSKRIIEHLNRTLELIKEFASAMNVTMEQIEEIRKNKRDKNGGFEKGYVLKQTSLKDTIIDDEREFNPNDCNEIYEVPRELSKYIDVLCDYKKNQTCLVLRFSLPIAVNNWEIIFESENFKKILEGTGAVRFTATKTKTGRVKLGIQKRPSLDWEQLLLFE